MKGLLNPVGCMLIESQPKRFHGNPFRRHHFNLKGLHAFPQFCFRRRQGPATESVFGRPNTCFADENKELQEKTVLNVESQETILNCPFIKIVCQPKKTPQMIHFQYLLEAIGYKHDWIMFCDDDDTYHEDRALNFAYQIQQAKQNPVDGCKLIGLYEGVTEKLEVKPTLGII